jgi:hypothetical protein
MDNNTKLDPTIYSVNAECNFYVAQFIKNNPGSKLPISDIKQGFLINKIADLQLRIEQLEKRNANTQSFIGRNTPLK